jgi:glutathione S-transferase
LTARYERHGVWLLGGGPTVADIANYGTLDCAPVGGFDLNAFRNLSAWIARFRAPKGFGAQDAMTPRASRAA